eukprot:1023255-Pelagomonas_calceolata.AAC.6
MAQQQRKMGNFSMPLAKPAADSRVNSQMLSSKSSTKPLLAMRGPKRPEGKPRSHRTLHQELSSTHPHPHHLQLHPSRNLMQW